MKKKMRPEITGDLFESSVETILIGCKYKKLTNKEINKLLQNIQLVDTEHNKYYVRKFKLGICLYPLLSRSEDFFLLNSPSYPSGLLISAKRQQSTGSVYEKAPYIIKNIKEYHPYPTIVVWDGDFKLRGVKGAYLWMKQQIGGRFIDVFTINEFMSWANRGNL